MEENDIIGELEKKTFKKKSLGAAQPGHPWTNGDVYVNVQFKFEYDSEERDIRQTQAGETLNVTQL
jgi:hypothetical protein